MLLLKIDLWRRQTGIKSINHSLHIKAQHHCHETTNWTADSNRKMLTISQPRQHFSVPSGTVFGWQAVQRLGWSSRAHSTDLPPRSTCSVTLFWGAPGPKTKSHTGTYRKIRPAPAERLLQEAARSLGLGSRTPPVPHSRRRLSLRSNSSNQGTSLPCFWYVVNLLAKWVSDKLVLVGLIYFWSRENMAWILPPARRGAVWCPLRLHQADHSPCPPCIRSGCRMMGSFIFSPLDSSIAPVSPW